MLYSEVKKIIEADYRDELENLLTDYDEDIILGYFNNTKELGNFEEAYQGKYLSDEDFVRVIVEETVSELQNLPNYIYIDWERTAHDVMMDYFEVAGYYFRSM